MPFFLATCYAALTIRGSQARRQHGFPRGSLSRPIAAVNFDGSNICRYASSLEVFAGAYAVLGILDSHEYAERPFGCITESSTQFSSETGREVYLPCTTCARGESPTTCTECHVQPTEVSDQRHVDSSLPGITDWSACVTPIRCAGVKCAIHASAYRTLTRTSHALAPTSAEISR